jgi:hypothetical protein
MIGLRRAVLDVPRQTVKAIPCDALAKGQEHPPLQCENTKIVAAWSFGGGSAQSMFIELLPGVIVVRSQQYLRSVKTLMRHVPIRCAGATKIAQ